MLTEDNRLTDEMIQEWRRRFQHSPRFEQRLQAAQAAMQRAMERTEDDVVNPMTSAKAPQKGANTIEVDLDPRREKLFQPAVEVLVREIAEQLKDLPERPENLPPIVLEPVILETRAPTFREVFRDSVWNRRWFQTALVVLFLFATIAFGALWLKEWNAEQSQDRDDIPLDVSVEKGHSSTFRIFGNHDKKLYFRSSLSFDWQDLDPFDPPPRWLDSDGVFVSLHRVIDPTTARETFLLQLAPDFEGFVELYHAGRQRTIVRLRESDLPDSASPDEARQWLESRYQAAIAEVSRLTSEQNRLLNSGDATASLQRDFELAQSREAALGYCARRIREAPQLFLWSQVKNEE